MMSATLALSPVTVLKRDTLFVTEAALSVISATYDVLPNGHFVMTKSVATTAPPVLVFGWVDELRERVEAATKK